MDKNIKLTDEELEWFDFDEKLYWIEQLKEICIIVNKGKEGCWSSEKVSLELDPYVENFKKFEKRLEQLRRANDRGDICIKCQEYILPDEYCERHDKFKPRKCSCEYFEER